MALPLPKEWDASYKISVAIRSHRDSNQVLKSLREKWVELIKGSL
jgi:hypothetical protein